MTVADVRVAAHRRMPAVLAVTGIAYSLSWAAGLSVGAPSPQFTSSGAAIVTALAGHQAAIVTQFTLTSAGITLGRAGR